MRVRKAIKLLLCVAGLGLIVFVIGAYVQASRVPDDYRPARLNSDQRRETIRDFGKQLQYFVRESQKGQAFELSVSQGLLNDYLGSMDEIASHMPGDIEPGRADEVMRRAGVADPAVALQDDAVVLMVRSTEHNKVLSVELAMSMADDGRLRVRMGEARIGRLAVPAELGRRALGKLKRALRRRAARNTPETPETLAGLSAHDMGVVLSSVIGAIDEDPIPVEWEFERRRMRIAGIRITAERLVLSVEPVEPWPSDPHAERQRQG